MSTIRCEGSSETQASPSVRRNLLSGFVSLAITSVAVACAPRRMRENDRSRPFVPVALRRNGDRGREREEDTDRPRPCAN